jgi:hypothetical protein
MPAGELAKVMDALRAAMDTEDVQAIHAALMRAVEGYHPELRHLPQSQTTNGSASASVNRGGH